MSGEWVLIVDDEPEMVKVCTRMLSAEGYRVRGFTNGKEAVACLAEEQFDLLLVDFVMPDMDGLTVLRRARELDPGITAVVITAYGTLKNAIDSLQAGARGFLLKPFDLDDLSRAVSDALEEHQREQEYLLLKAQMPILEIGQALMIEADVADLAKKLVKIVMQQVGADQASLMLLNKEEDALYTAGAIGPGVTGVDRSKIPLQGGRVEQSLRRREPFVLERGSERDPRWQIFGVGPQVAAVCVPLCTRQKAVGMMNLSRMDGDATFTPADLSLLSILGNQIATALDNVRLYETVAQHNRELETLNRAGQALNSSLDLDRVLVTVLEEVRRLLDVVACSVWLVDPEKKELVCRQSTGRHSGVVRGWRLPLGEGISGWVAQTRQSLIVPDAQEDERYFGGVDRETGLSLHSVLCVPLCVKDEVIGVLHVVDTEIDRFGPPDLTLVESLAASAASAIENAQLFEQARHEISERKRAEEESRHRNEELAALNAIASAVSRSLELPEILEAALAETLNVLHAEGGLIYLFDKASQTFKPFAHRGISQTLLRQVAEFKLGEGLSGRVAQTGEPRSVSDLAKETQNITPAAIEDGWRSLASAPLTAKRGIVGVMTVVSDAKAKLGQQSLSLLAAIGSQVGVAVENVKLASEAAEVEILRELDRLRSELIANVSHELRTPLGLIKVLATSLLMEDVEFDRETQQKFLSGIEDETVRLEAIVDNLLNLSQVESGRLPLDKCPTDLGQLAYEVIEVMRMDCQIAQHHLVHDFPSESLVAAVDAGGIEQVLRNLLSNAIKYSPEGGTITVHGKSDKEHVIVSVHDEGVGIPPGDLERIFDRFIRLDNETIQSVGGVGLGLAVCRSIVMAHGGRIWAESTLGEGSSFHFALPIGVG